MGHIPPKDRTQKAQGEVRFRALLYDRACRQIMGAPTWGVFVAAQAPAGASNTIAGLVAAVDPTTRHLPTPAVHLTDRSMLDRTLTRGLTTRKKNNGMIRSRGGEGR
jgi:hypothetical protein